MKKLLVTAMAVALLLGSVAAHAQEKMGGLGFRTLNGPGIGLPNSGVSVGASPTIGIRQWFTPQFGVDLAVGFTSLKVEAGPPTTDTAEGTGFAFDVGVPYSLKTWDKVNFIFRPGFLYGKATAKDKLALLPPNEDTVTLLSVSGELEVEYMVAEKLSISAAHGIAYSSLKLRNNDTPESEDNLTGFGTTGDNFTHLGFHVYLW
jgi:outer membrane protein with beta-barrel domain